MKTLWIAALTFLTLTGVPQLFAEPADTQIKGALIDIERYEQQFGSVSSANASTVNRTLKLLSLTRQRLDSSSNKTHESWKDADSRYHALVARLNRLLNPNSTAAAVAATPTPQTRQPSPPATTGSQQMISQQRVRIQKIKRDIESSFQTMDQGGVAAFQDPEYAAKFEQSAQRYADSIAKYAEFQTDPDVIAANEALAKYQNMIAFGNQRAAKEQAELGDVQGALKTLEQQLRQLRQPPTPQAPYQSGQLGQWLVELAKMRQTAAELHKPLPQIKQRAYLPNNPGTVQSGAPYDLNDVDRLERSLIGLVRSIDSELESFKTNLVNQVPHIRSLLAAFGEYDPASEDDQINHFLGEGRADENRAMLAEHKQTVEEIVQFSKLLKDPAESERVALASEVQSTIDTYERNYQKARELVRMPAAASKDSKLTAIAEDTLANYEYVGKIRRLVINADKAHHSEETSEQKFDDASVSLSGTITLTGTKTTYFYEWDQFQVATAEPVGAKHYIFYNTLKYYTSGDSTTPLNKWIISSRIQGPEIPEANISK